MTPQLWSWLLTAVGVTGLWLAGASVMRVRTYGWSINLCAQTLWVVYAITTKQYGFLFAAAAYTFVFARNLYRNLQMRKLIGR